MIYRSTTSGSWSTHATASSVSGDQVLFDGVTLSSDGYYALATLDNTNSPIGQAPVATMCKGPGGIGEIDGSSNLKLWLDVEAMGGDHGDPLVSFNDFSGNENHATIFSPINIPVFATNVVNNQDAISFDGNDYIEGNLDINLNADATIVSVGYFDEDQGSGDNDYLISIGSPTTANENCSIARRRGDDTGNENKYYSWTGTNAIFGPTISTDTWNVFLQEQTTTGNFHNLYINGMSETVSPNPAAYSSSSSVYRIGMWQNANNSGLDGYVAETIIYNRLLNSAERNILNSYLGAKYDIAITNDKYSGDDAGNGDNDIYVAGIGTEADGSNICATSKGMTITQNSNFDNGDYLLVGIANDVNTVNTTDITEVSSAITARWERQWYADVTDVGATMTVDVTFDFKDIDLDGFPDGNTTCYSLIYRSGSSGTWTALASSTSIVGDQVSFTNVPFSGDGYYTLATCNLITNPLPVTIISYVVEKENEQVKNSWLVISDRETEYFVIERSSDAFNFEEIGIVDAIKSDRYVMTDYTFYDQSPLDGASYYRIKQVSRHGDFAYSKIKSINIDVIEYMYSYPNPTNQYLNIVINSTYNTELYIDIHNMLGYKIMEKRVLLEKGFSNNRINLELLSSGSYYLKMRTPDGNYQEYKKIYIDN